MAQRIKSALPYLLGLAIAVLLFALSGSISYSPRPGQLGPDFWPRLAIGLMAAVCIFEIVRILFLGSLDSDIRGIAERLDDTEPDEDADAPVKPHLLIGGIGLILAYAIAVPVLGFLLASYIFLIVFMYLGGARNHVAVWLAGTLGILIFAFVFLKVVYVSLPRGEPPFDRVTQFVMNLLQVN